MVVYYPKCKTIAHLITYVAVGAELKACCGKCKTEIRKVG